MPLLDVRKQFIQFSGRYDLVIDQTDWADNGADFFIRAGLKWLDRFGDIAKNEARYFEPLTAGRWNALIPARSIREVWIHSADGCKCKLRKLEFKEMRKKYPCDPARANHCTPLHYAVMPIRALPEVQHQTTVDIYDGTIYSNQLLPQYFMLQNADVGDIYTVYIDAAHQLLIMPGQVPETFAGKALQPLFSTTPYGSIQLLASDDINVPMYIAVDIAGQLFATPLAPAGITVVMPAQTLSMRNLDNLADIITVHSIGEISVQAGPLTIPLSDYGFTGLMFMPPSSAGMELEVVCSAHQHELNLNTDENFWTEENPFILVMAACRALEISYRNNAGVTDWENAIKTEILGLEYDYAEELSNEFTQMEG